MLRAYFFPIIILFFQEMFTYIKAQATLVAGSLSDYVLTIMLVEIIHTGDCSRQYRRNQQVASCEFVLGRNWAFRAGAGAGFPAR